MTGPDGKTEAPSILAERALVSFRLLFPASRPRRSDFSVALGDALGALRAALENPSPAILTHAPSGTADVIDALNALAVSVGPEGFSRRLDSELFDALSESVPKISLHSFDGEDSDAAFFLRHARRLAECLTTLIPDFIAALPAPGTEELSRLRPSAAALCARDSAFLRLRPAAVALECASREAGGEFSAGRVFRYRNGAFIPVVLESVRPVEAFYGFRAARRVFLDHFSGFAAGKSNLPLLISSLPGLGKTQMTISHSLHDPGITLILASPEALSAGLEDLIRQLSEYKKRKFMVFFDDIDVPATDWYFFRTHVGGTFSLPPNITLTIAANQQFPANISSRGRGFVFPIFDEVRCQEMIEDFLLAVGMKSPSPELVSVIAADYVESFGQKLFEELSPRTLVRYLDTFRLDAAKRKTMLDSSRGEIIARPDPQVFYDENLKLMRAIYGDAVLDEFRRKELHG